jgi:uncharacterized membrane protein
MADALFVLVRWMHIASVAMLVGGLLFARLVMSPALAGAAPEMSGAVMERAAARFRPLVLMAMALLTGSGVFNILTTPGHRPVYHIVLGIKLLLVLHVFGISLLVVRPAQPRRERLITGAMISGLAILLISSWLRRHF